MSKLLLEPRIIKKITSPKVKTRKVKLTPDEKSEIKYTLIRQEVNPLVDEFFKLYKENPFKARVKAFNSKQKVSFKRTCIFERGKNDFEICVFENYFGISVSNRVYSSQKKLMSISYKGGKFWFIHSYSKRIKPLAYEDIISIISIGENLYGSMISDSIIFKFLIGKFSFIKVLHEHPLSGRININVVKSKHLTSLGDISRHMLNVPLNIAKIVMTSSIFRRMQRSDKLKEWKEILRYLNGVENLSFDMINSEYFYDTFVMARTLGRKINCRWGIARLKSEHDTWAREIGNIILDCEDEYELNIRKYFKLLAEFSGYKMITTNKELIIEGMVQKHCVGTYIDRVNNGSCAIFNVDGYTLQIGIEVVMSAGKFSVKTSNIQLDNALLTNFLEKEINFLKETNEEINFLKETNEEHKEITIFKILQFKGKHNCQAPIELFDSVNFKLKEFSENGLFNQEDDDLDEYNRKSRELKSKHKIDDFFNPNPF